MDKEQIISNLIKDKRYSEAAELINSKLSTEDYWVKNYHSMSSKEKVKFWSGYIGRQMRWNNESGVDEMDVFNVPDFKIWLKYEPNILQMLKEVIKVLKLYENVVLSRIGISNE
jgi:hypothetical protein